MYLLTQLLKSRIRKQRVNFRRWKFGGICARPWTEKHNGRS